MKRLLALFASMVATAAIADFAAYVDVTVNEAYTGGAVTDFPVLVKIDGEKIPGFYSTVKNGGADLKFTDANGQGEYPFEVDTWDESGTSLVWVKLPSFSASAAFRMYYGDESVATNDTAADVWTGYGLVCHVNGNAADSSANAVPGALNPAAHSVADGMVGSAYGQDGSEEGCVMANWFYKDVAAGALAHSSFTASCWVRYSTTPPTNQKLCGVGNGFWGVYTIGDPSNTMQMRTHTAGTCQYGIQATGGFAPNRWFKMDAVFDGLVLSFFLNGVQIGQPLTVTEVATITWVNWLAWGGEVKGNGATPTLYDATYPVASMPVDIDECRIFNSAMTAARAAADYFVVANDACVFGEPHGGEPEPAVAPNGLVIY